MELLWDCPDPCGHFSASVPPTHSLLAAAAFFLLVLSQPKPSLQISKPSVLQVRTSKRCRSLSLHQNPFALFPGLTLVYTSSGDARRGDLCQLVLCPRFPDSRARLWPPVFLQMPTEHPRPGGSGQGGQGLHLRADQR